MMSFSPVQCHQPVVCGASSCKAPRVCPISCAAVVADQHPCPLSTRAYSGVVPLLAFAAPRDESGCTMPIPQNVLLTAKIRYLRSARSYPRACNAFVIVPNVDMVADVIDTGTIEAWHPPLTASVTQGTNLLPPICAADVL